MNIMIITPNLSGGGAEKIAANLSLELANRSNLYVLTYMTDEKEYDYAGTRININCSGRGGIQKLFCAVKRIFMCKKAIKKYHIDCVISFLPQTDYVNVLSKSKKNKSIITIVSNMSLVYPSGFGKKFRKFVIKHSDHVVCVSEGVRQDIVENFGCLPQKSSVIYNSCNISDIKQVCDNDIEYQENKNNLPKKYIVSMGSFRHPKGHWHLIKAFASVKDEIPDVSLVILGDGVYRKQYEELINNLALEGRVYLPGFINPPFSIIAHSELFVFSSVFEGFGNAVIEAIACKIPVLSTDCDYGPREILAPGTSLKDKANKFQKCEYGCLIPDFGQEPIDTSENINAAEKEMGESIKELLNNEELRKEYSQKGISYVEKFDNEVFTENWIELINNLIGEQNG